MRLFFVVFAAKGKSRRGNPVCPGSCKNMDDFFRRHHRHDALIVKNPTSLFPDLFWVQKTSIYLLYLFYLFCLYLQSTWQAVKFLKILNIIKYKQKLLCCIVFSYYSYSIYSNFIKNDTFFPLIFSQNNKNWLDKAKT
jgi:hypothetical protein